MSAIVRHWSTMLNGSQVDLTTFKKQADDVFAASRRSRSEEIPARRRAPGSPSTINRPVARRANGG